MTDKKPKVKAHWDIQLYFECPVCEGEIDYFDTTDYLDNDGCEGLPDVLKAGDHEITCNCGTEITLDIQSGW
jgi:transcription initiation factor IIE alpha subunit